MGTFRPRVQPLLRRVGGTICGLLLAACTLVGGGIPPSQFHFSQVIALDGPGAGGWKVAQVAILLGRLSPTFPQSTICEVEVQVPVVTHLGPISDELAQVHAAEAANAAARLVLQERPFLTAVLCKHFREEMQRILNTAEAIPGARVTRFMTTGVPRTTFP